MSRKGRGKVPCRPLSVVRGRGRPTRAPRLRASTAPTISPASAWVRWVPELNLWRIRELLADGREMEVGQMTTARARPEQSVRRDDNRASSAAPARTGAARPRGIVIAWTFAARRRQLLHSAATCLGLPRRTPRSPSSERALRRPRLLRARSARAVSGPWPDEPAWHDPPLPRPPSDLVESAEPFGAETVAERAGSRFHSSESVAENALRLLHSAGYSDRAAPAAPRPMRRELLEVSVRRCSAAPGTRTRTRAVRPAPCPQTAPQGRSTSGPSRNLPARFQRGISPAATSTL